MNLTAKEAQRAAVEEVARMALEGARSLVLEAVKEEEVGGVCVGVGECGGVRCMCVCVGAEGVEG